MCLLSRGWIGWPGQRATLLNVIAAIADRGAGFKSLKDAWADTTSAHGRLMLTVLGGLAEFERELIRARTGEGRKRAKERGSGEGLKLPAEVFPYQQTWQDTVVDAPMRFALERGAKISARLLSVSAKKRPKSTAMLLAGLMGGRGRYRQLTHRSAVLNSIGRRPDCVAGHVGLELTNVVAKYPFERSHRFPVIEPNSGRRDYSH